MILPKDNNPLAAQRVKQVHNYRDVSGFNESVDNRSATIVSWTGANISDNIGAVLMSNVGNGILYLEPSGTAGLDSYPIPPGGFYLLCGRADELRLAHICAAPDTIVGFMYKQVYQ
jgi:hypothetical protein